MSASPRCPSCGISVGEYTPLFKEARAFYRKKYKGDEKKVSKELEEMCNNYVITGPCCRQMMLNVDTPDDFIARINTYK